MRPIEEARPKYIIVFRETGEQNVSTISRILNVGEERGASTQPGCVVLSSKRPDLARPRIYMRLGVAVADLDLDDVQAMRREEAVEAVILNELRRIPPPPKKIPGIQVGLERVSPTAPTGAIPKDLAIAYLQGMRDSANAALRYLTGEAEIVSESPAPPAAQLGAHSWCLDLVGIDEGYQKATGKGVKVAVLDTGIDLAHPDFSGRFPGVANTASFVPGSPSAQDGNGHGTHCAGIVAGPQRSSGGIRYGVAPDVTLLVGKVLSDEGSGYDEWILNGIDWAVDQGASVISMSLGSPRYPNQPYSQAYETVARLLLNEGVLIVAAAGNDSYRPFFIAPVENPAACPSIMAVAAVDRFRQVAYFSCAQMDNIGEVNVSAPGVDVHSSWTGSTFNTISGTSMATPHVAGIAALYVELHRLSGRQLWDKLERTAYPLPGRQDYGAGIAQAPR